MITADVSKIVVPENRVRRQFDPARMLELESSIASIGILHPIIVERQSDNTLILRAGERRLRVLQKLAAAGTTIRYGEAEYHGGAVPVLDFAELTDVERLQVEVEENVVRADFTWQERTRGLAALHELRSRQNPQQTITATATEVLGTPAVGDQRQQVSDALIVARHLDDPEVARAKDQREAVKVIRKKAEAVHRARLAIVFDRTKTRHSITHGDCLEIIKAMPAGQFDVICTDPPYGIGADGFGEMSGTGHDYDDSKANFDRIKEICPDELFRLAKPAAHLYWFCDPRKFDELATLFLLAGWTVFETPLIWDKSSGMLPHPDHGPRRTYETILYGWKGGRHTLVVKDDVIRGIPPVRNLRHGAQKPVALVRELLSRSANPGDSVLDLFGGTGSILPAANMSRLTATYIESNEASYNIALTRAAISEIDDGAIEDDGLNLQI